jgi:DNA-binding MarR family transcriptional regulator
MNPITTTTTSEIFLQTTIERFWETFPAVWDRLRSNVRAIASEQFDISVEQFQILRLIRRGRTSVSELADVKQISRSAISQAVEVLVAKGLVNRKQNTEDRRSRKLELTARGNDLLNAIYRQNRNWMMEKMSSLDPTQADCIIKSLETLKRIFLES